MEDWTTEPELKDSTVTQDRWPLDKVFCTSCETIYDIESCKLKMLMVMFRSCVSLLRGNTNGMPPRRGALFAMLLWLVFPSEIAVARGVGV